MNQNLQSYLDAQIRYVPGIKRLTLIDRDGITLYSHDRDENGRPVGTGPVIAQTYVSVIDQLIKIQRASHHDTQNPQQDKKSQEKKCEEHLIVVQRDDHQLVQMNIGDPGHIFVLSWILDADAVTGVFIDKSRTIKTELEPILCTS